jgi:hypothetical protein
MIACDSWLCGVAGIIISCVAQSTFNQLSIVQSSIAASSTQA